MINTKGFWRSAVVATFFAVIAALPVTAQSQQVTTKTVFENDKMVITENVLKPGDKSPSRVRGGRVNYYITGGTVERTFADGSKETVTTKTGEARMNSEKRPYAVVNIGKTSLDVLTISLK